jgi:hypothetical protein
MQATIMLLANHRGCMRRSKLANTEWPKFTQATISAMDLYD